MILARWQIGLLVLLFSLAAQAYEKLSYKELINRESADRAIDLVKIKDCYSGVAALSLKYDMRRDESRSNTRLFNLNPRQPEYPVLLWHGDLHSLNDQKDKVDYERDQEGLFFALPGQVIFLPLSLKGKKSTEPLKVVLKLKRAEKEPFYVFLELDLQPTTVGVDSSLLYIRDILTDYVRNESELDADSKEGWLEITPTGFFNAKAMPGYILWDLSQVMSAQMDSVLRGYALTVTKTAYVANLMGSDVNKGIEEQMRTYQANVQKELSEVLQNKCRGTGLTNMTGNEDVYVSAEDEIDAILKAMDQISP